MTNKGCAEILKRQCSYASMQSPFYPLGEVDSNLLWDAVNHAIKVLEKTPDESEYERGMNDIWEALRCCNDMSFSDRIHYYAVKAPSITITDILRYYSYQEFMTMHKGAMEKKEKEKIDNDYRRGDKIRCISNKSSYAFDALFLGESDERYFVLTKEDKLPQKISKNGGWTILKLDEHVDLDSLLG